jgi:hypothetical protein
MILKNKRHFIGIFMSVVVVASTADARPAQKPRRQEQIAREATFDGEWTVVLRTDEGVCERASRYGVDIKSGEVTYEGTSYGRVRPDGRVRVQLSLGQQHAEGLGRLSRNSGAGVWHGAGAMGTCGGRWFAERRQNYTSGRGQR